MTLTRQLKEAWLFGRLDTVRVGPANERAERQAHAILNRLSEHHVRS